MSVEASASSSHSTIDKRDGEFDYLQYSKHSFQNHHALCNITENSLNEILSADAFLDDIPYDITYEEVQAQVSMGNLVLGQTIWEVL